MNPPIPSSNPKNHPSNSNSPIHSPPSSTQDQEKPIQSPSLTSPPNPTTFQQAIIEIYESLYHFQRQRTGQQEARVIDCISKWYESNAVFENPFTRANGIQSIVNQFSLMSLIPGQIWSELGDVCSSEDYNGNRVVVFSHTLHFNLLGNHQTPNPDLATAYTPYPSVPPTPHTTTPNLMARFPTFHSAILARMSLGPAVKIDHPLRVKRAGSGTTWPITWLISHLSPSKLTENLAKFDLKLSTRLQFNEQARIVTHEDTWGLKESIEFLAPSMFSQAYCLQRWLIGICGDFLSERYLRTPLSKSIQNKNHHSHSHRFQSYDSHLHDPHHLNPSDHHHPPIGTSLHSPILIGSTASIANLRPANQTEGSRSSFSISPTSNCSAPQNVLFEDRANPNRDDHPTVEPKKTQHVWYHHKLRAQQLQRRDGSYSTDGERAEDEDEEELNTSEGSLVVDSRTSPCSRSQDPSKSFDWKQASRPWNPPRLSRPTKSS